jgi:VWFA-related protein
MKRKTYFIVLLAIVAAITSGDYVWSQIRARVELVVVPVNVRDSDGKLVTGLKKDDFVITEDGVPQTISNFSLDPAPLSAAIVIDDGMGSNALKRLIPLLDVMTSGFTAEDEMIAFRYDHFVWKLSNFTHNKATIKKSFNELPKIAEGRQPEGEPGEPLGTAPGWLRIDLGTNGPPVPVPTAVDRPKPVRTSRVLHNAMYDAANALKGRPETFRKIVFIVSDGQVGGSGNTQSFEKTLELMLQNQIQVYAVAVDYALREGLLNVLHGYAKTTGGDVFGGGSSRDMETAFLKITEQARNQYVLSYVSTNEPRSLQGVRREIKVKTRQSGYSVAHRNSYIQYPAK